MYLFILFCLYHLLEQLVCLILASEDHAVDFQPLCFRKIGLLVCGTVNQHRNGQGCQTLCGVIGITFVITFLMAKPIGAYQLGEAYAQSMGVNIKVFRIALILLSSILSACVTAFAGPISFVGIAVPFLVKQSLGTSRPLVVIPGTFLGGAVFCMMCDLIARMAFAPLELSISTVTSIFGAPVVIFMMLRRKRG